MFDSQLSRKICLAVAAAGLLAVAGCSTQPDTTATNQAPKPNQKPTRAAKAAPKAAPAKPAAAKPATAKATNQKSATPKAVPVSAKATQPASHVLTVPKGTAITATVDQTLASSKNHKGDTFAASLAAPVKVDGKTVLPKGAKVTGKVINVRKNELKVELASVVVHGKSYDLETNSLRPSDKAKSASSNKASNKNADKQKKDNSTLSANSKLTFKLAKPVTVPVKG